MSVHPVLAALVGVVLLGQLVQLHEWLGIMVVVATDAVAVPARRPRETRHAGGHPAAACRPRSASRRDDPTGCRAGPRLLGVPLDSYGVLAGTLHRSFRDRPDDQGRWFHVNLEVDAPAGRYRCAVDVDSKASAVGVRWKVLTLAGPQLAPVSDLAPGVHALASEPGSGALDYHRHAALAPHLGCLAGLLPAGVARRALDRLTEDSWISGSHLQAAEALEPILVPGRRVLIFGEPFETGLGMHNIHQNQGDPAGSQWWDENAIWQDGGTVTERPDGRFDVFLCTFSSQAFRTDDEGHPEH